MKIFTNIRRAIIPEFSVLDTSFCMRIVSSASRQRSEYLEKMAAAFRQECKIPIKYCELVEKHHSDGTIAYFYRDKRIK